jgi:hypothetical protein
MWIEHDDVFYNLDKFSQIVRGDEDEILFVSLSHNMNWDGKDEENIISLRFKSNDERELAFRILQVKLKTKFLGDLKNEEI